MTRISEGTPRGLTPIAEIAKVPGIKEDIKVKAECAYCLKICEVLESQTNGSGSIISMYCPNCQDRLKKEKEYYEKEQKEMQRLNDINRLGGLKAYEQFTKAKFINTVAWEKCAGFPCNNIFIWGPAGTGKTHLGTAKIRGGNTAEVWKPQQIYRKCRGLKDGDEEQRAIDYFVNLKYLMIDDLGVDKKTDFSFSILYEIIEGRDMACRPGLIITSNLSLAALAERLGDDRISSRLAGMCKVIELSGKDWRLNHENTKTSLPENNTDMAK